MADTKLSPASSTLSWLTSAKCPSSPTAAVVQGISGIHIYPHFGGLILNSILYLKPKQPLFFQGHLCMSQSGSLENLHFQFFAVLISKKMKTCFSVEDCVVLLQGFLQLLPPELVFQMHQCRAVLLRGSLQPFPLLYFPFFADQYKQLALISSFSSKPQLHWNRNWLLTFSTHRENYQSASPKGDEYMDWW